MSSPVMYGRPLLVGEFDVPRLCDLGRAAVVLSNQEWAVACQIDGRATVGELAKRSGIEVADAVEQVTRLVRNGLCAIDLEPAAGGASPRTPEDEAFAASLPRRVREPARAVNPLLARPDIRLLRRVLDGLNSLD